MAVMPAPDVDPAVGRVPGAVSAGLGNGAGDQRATGAGVGRGAAVGSDGLNVGGGPGDGAACGREVPHPPAATRMATQAVAIRFLNEAQPR